MAQRNHATPGALTPGVVTRGVLAALAFVFAAAPALAQKQYGPGATDT